MICQFQAFSSFKTIELQLAMRQIFENCVCDWNGLFTKYGKTMA